MDRQYGPGIGIGIAGLSCLIAATTGTTVTMTAVVPARPVLAAVPPALRTLAGRLLPAAGSAVTCCRCCLFGLLILIRMRGLGGCGDIGQRRSCSVRFRLFLGVLGLLFGRFCSAFLWILLALFAVALLLAARLLLRPEMMLVMIRAQGVLLAVFDRLVVGHDASAGTMFTGLAEDFQQTGSHPLAGHLHQPQRRHFQVGS